MHVYLQIRCRNSREQANSGNFAKIWKMFVNYLKQNVGKLQTHQSSADDKYREKHA